MTWNLQWIGVLAVACAWIVSGCNGGFTGVTGSGVVGSQTRPVSGFSEVVLAGSGDAVIVIGEKESITVEAEENLLPLLETEVEGNRLRVGTQEGITLRPTKPISYRIEMRKLSSVTISGSGSAKADGIEAEALEAEITGSGNIELGGKAKRVEARIAGSGFISTERVVADSVTAVISGSGTIVVHATKELNAEVRGSGTIEHVGTAKVTSRVLGSGQVVAKGK